MEVFLITLIKLIKEDQLWKGECFVFDERVSVNPDLEEGNFEQCFGCRRPISNEDISSKKYKKGVSCPYCYDTSSDEDKTRFSQRQKQIELAESKGLKHMGKSRKEINLTNAKKNSPYFCFNYFW